MKTMLKVLSLAAILAASAPLALADNISGDILLAGAGQFNTSGSAPNLVGMFTAGTGNSSVTGADGTPFTDFLGAPSAGIVFKNFVTTDTGDLIFSITLASGEQLSFTETSFGEVSKLGTGGSVLITGTIADTGASTTFIPVAGLLGFSESGLEFSFTEDSVSTGGGKLSTAPEPSGLVLLGTGLLTAVGVARRKLKV